MTVTASICGTDTLFHGLRHRSQSKRSRYNKHGKIVLALVTLEMIIGLMLMFTVRVPIHEGGHLLACQMIGGFPDGWNYVEGGAARADCNYPENVTGSDVMVFLLGGVGAEFVLATILILIPFTSMIGGLWYLVMGLALVTRNFYIHDLAGTVFVQQPVPLVFFVLGILAMAVSMTAMIGFFERVVE